MDVDRDRKRIALTMRLSDKAQEQADKHGEPRRHSGGSKPGRDNPTRGKSGQSKPAGDKPAANNAFAAAFANARQEK
jgi:uncharacterized protein